MAAGPVVSTLWAYFVPSGICQTWGRDWCNGGAGDGSRGSRPVGRLGRRSAAGGRGFDGVSLGVMSFAFGVFDLAVHHGATSDLKIRLVAGEPDAVMRGAGMSYPVPCD